MFKNNPFPKSEQASCCLIRRLCSIPNHRLSNSLLHTHIHKLPLTYHVPPPTPTKTGWFLGGYPDTLVRRNTPILTNDKSTENKHTQGAWTVQRTYTRSTKTWRIGEEEHLNFNTFICILQTFGKQMKETATMEQCLFPRDTHPRSNSLMYFAGLQRRTRERERVKERKFKSES